MPETKGYLIFISGISGSGKTTVGKRLEALIENVILIDQDNFFTRSKPFVKLSSGEPVINYDSELSIRWNDLNDAIRINLESHNVIVTGFALRKNRIAFIPHYHFLLIRDILVNGKHNTKTLEKFCYEDRQLSKRFNGKESEKLIVPELLVPFYFETLTLLPGKVIIINTMVNNRQTYERMDISSLIGYILKQLPNEIY